MTHIFTIPPYTSGILVLYFFVLTGCSFSSPIKYVGFEPSVYALDTTQTPPIFSPSAPTITRLKPANWDDVPGLMQDSVHEAVPALLQSCKKPHPAWKTPCAAALFIEPGSDESMRKWLQTYLRPWRITDLEDKDSGLLTGYYEPTFQALRKPNEVYRFPVYSNPHLQSNKAPIWSRYEMDTNAVVIKELEPYVLGYLADPVDVMILHIQGSGRLVLTENDDSKRNIRLAYAGHNGYPYHSVGKWLVQQGWISPQQASWAGIREWILKNPHRASQALWSNPRVIFFREEPLINPQLGPKGAQDIPLTPERSVAIDPRVAPYGTLMWIQSQHPTQRQQLFERLVVAQDTGSAIVGAIRADLFWGWNAKAQDAANRTQSPLKWWVLWPITDTNYTPTPVQTQLTNND